MEKIIAKEIHPNGVDNEIFELLEAEQDSLGLTDAIVYYGFPIFKDYEAKPVESKFAILSKLHGLLLLQSSNPHRLVEDDENLTQLFTFVESALRKSKILRINKKKLAVEVESYILADTDDDELENEVIISHEGLKNTLLEAKRDEPISQAHFDEARSIIEGAKALTKTSKRTKLNDDPTSKLNILIELEKEISNFDIDQRKTAISLINGPQRIRGLAGSGKTVVLAMKAAHIHLQYPEKRILFTFYTKSLYGLITDMLSRFYRHFSGNEPNWDNIDILHAWGGRYVDGVCFNACSDNSLSIMTFDQAKSKNSKDPFSAVCARINEHKLKPKYDYILIDEAQDLPNEFFRICYDLATGERGEDKNIVWAYDELQSIFNVYQRTPAELFGNDSRGNPKVDLSEFSRNLRNGQSNDLILHKCYRNPLEVLVTAHALGFAVYSDAPVQMLENREHWEDVGYTVRENPDLTIGQEVVIRRDRKNSPLSIGEYQTSQDLVQCQRFDSLLDEVTWIAEEIHGATQEGLIPEDILVICLDDRNAKRYFSRLSLELSERGIRSNNLLSSAAAAPPFHLDSMVTLSTVHRAKGNEAALVFTAGIDALYCSKQYRETRNKLFTAFTRTKAWLRVTGMGERAESFFNEIHESLEKCPDLRFIVPDNAEIETIQRDLESQTPLTKKLHGYVAELEAQGYTKEEIQMELSFIADEKENG